MSWGFSEKTSGRISCDIMDKKQKAQIWDLLFGREYMEGVKRNEARIRAFGEVFTPKDVVDDILDRIEKSHPDLFDDSGKTVLDPACGDGEFLAGVLWRKVNNGVDFKRALNCLYGTDILLSNVKECQKRLLCQFADDDEAVKIVKQNILSRNALKYDFSFGKKMSSADLNHQDDWIEGEKAEE